MIPSENINNSGRLPLKLLIATVLIPFSTGYFFLQFFRAINATIAGRLTSDLNLDAPQLGLLTSMFFLAASSVQLPMGVAIDRYGPARVQGLFLAIALAGTLLFSFAADYLSLVIARFIIGVGVGTGLMAGLNAIVTWFPRERTGFYNGIFIAAGTLGAVASTAPVELALSVITWRELFLWLAALVGAQIALILTVVPPRPSSDAARSAKGGLGAIYSDPRFWRLTPLSILVLGTAWALIGLWAAPWLKDIDGLNQIEISQYLLAMMIAQGLGAIGFGAVIDVCRRRGIGPQAVLAVTVLVFIATELALALQMPVPPIALWIIVGVVSAGTVISFTITAEYFPREMMGRANSALNVLQLFTAFLIQFAIGRIVGLWERDPLGHYPPVSYHTALLCLVIMQGLALVWFLLPAPRAREISTPARSDLWALASGLLGVFTFGASAALTRIANLEIDPFSVAIIRSVGGGLLALALILALRPPVPRGIAVWLLLLVAAAASYAGFPVLLGMGVDMTSGSHAALMLASMPLMTAFLGALIERRIPGIAWFLGTAIAVSATAAIVLLQAIEDQHAATLTGDLMVLAASVVMAIGFVACSRAGARIGTTPATLWSMVAGAAILAPFSYDRLTVVTWSLLSTSCWIALAYIVVGVGLVAQLAWLFALTRGGMTRVAPIQLLQPVFALLMATLLLAEPPDPAVWIAAACVIAGVVLSRANWSSQASGRELGAGRSFGRPVLVFSLGIAIGWMLHSAIDTKWPGFEAALARIRIPTSSASIAPPAEHETLRSEFTHLWSATRRQMEEIQEQVRLSVATALQSGTSIDMLSKKLEAIETRLAERASQSRDGDRISTASINVSIAPSSQDYGSAAIPILGCAAATSGIRSVALQFSHNEKELSPEHIGILNRWQSQIAKCDFEAIFIDGFTDDSGSQQQNYILSEARARLVAEYLRKQGYRPDRLRIEGHGPEGAIASNDGEAGRARNRRVEISLVGRD